MKVIDLYFLCFTYLLNVFIHFIIDIDLAFKSKKQKNHEVHLIFISRLMMAYGISHYFKLHFNHSTTQPLPVQLLSGSNRKTCYLL